MKSQFLIASPHSGTGKTTVALGLLRALQDKGLRTQPFKCGPDFIDPIHHRTAARRDSINLDRFMMSDGHIHSLYDRYSHSADISITEGVMGLFDGSRRSEGSSADLARLLDLPILLVINAEAMAYSAAAILFGMKNFDQSIRIAGVIFNFVGADTHYKLLQEACKDVEVTAFGYLPANDRISIGSRHIGLDTQEAESAIAEAAAHIEKHIDIDALLAATAIDQANIVPVNNPFVANDRLGRRKKILVANDAAFHFLYTENIRRLEQFGDIHYFSPLRDQRFPVDADLIYLPGGYPELHLPALAGNTPMLEQLRSYYADGGKILAECGGMMYLGTNIVDERGIAYNMAGILQLATSIERKRLHMGYRTVVLNECRLKGHEFHYSQMFESLEPAAESQVCNAHGELVEASIFYTTRIFASYMHFYWGEHAGLLEEWLQ